MKVAVLLAGCGVYDGSEVYEATFTILHLREHHHEVTFFSVDKTFKTVNHASGEQTTELRNCIEESARIARGPVLDIAAIQVKDFDALVIPGGFGAAKNLSTFALSGTDDYLVDKSVSDAVLAFHAAKKPIVVMCIAPMIIAKTLKGVSVTIGNDDKTASAITKCGCTHKTTKQDDITIDKANKIISTPAFMCGDNLVAINAGIAKAIAELARL